MDNILTEVCLVIGQKEHMPLVEKKDGALKMEFAPVEINRNEYIVSPLIRILI